MVGGKCIPEGRKKPFYKHTALALEMKIRMILKYEGGQSLSATRHELGFAVSIMNTIMKDIPHIKEYMVGSKSCKL
jgi:hypothetical protein